MPSVASSSWRWRYWPLQPLLFLLTRPFWPVAVANSVMAVAGDVFGPAVAALTLGLFAQPLLARRMGRNAAFDHAGNVAIAVVAGAVGYAFSQRAVFLLVPVFAMLTVIAVLSIPAKAIDYNRARDLEVEPGAAESSTGVAGYGILFKSRPLVIFGLCVMLFHFANAPLLPLVGQKLAAAYPKEATAMMSTCSPHRRSCCRSRSWSDPRPIRGGESRSFSQGLPSCPSVLCSTRFPTTASG
jgi:hypothetical protein